jgi:hypothetical protein
VRSGQLTVLEEDILLDTKGARCVRYLSNGKEYGVHAAGASLGQSLKTQSTEEGLQWIYQMFPTTGGSNNNCLCYTISSAPLRLRRSAYMLLLTYESIQQAK